MLRPYLKVVQYYCNARVIKKTTALNKLKFSFAILANSHFKH